MTSVNVPSDGSNSGNGSLTKEPFEVPVATGIVKSSTMVSAEAATGAAANSPVANAPKNGMRAFYPRRAFACSQLYARFSTQTKRVYLRAREPLERPANFSPQASGADRCALAPELRSRSTIHLRPRHRSCAARTNLGETAPGFGWLSCAGGHQGVVADVIGADCPIDGRGVPAQNLTAGEQPTRDFRGFSMNNSRVLSAMAALMLSAGPFSAAPARADTVFDFSGVCDFGCTGNGDWRSDPCRLF